VPSSSGCSGTTVSPEECGRHLHVTSQGVVRGNIERATGRGRSTERAIDYFTLSANAGNGQAAANLGNLFARGTDGVQRDTVQAEAWYRRADMLGYAKTSEYVRALGAQRVAGN
jgi:TPR repeat protein